MNLALVLFIVFLVLKLTGLLAWSWAWITSPLWLPLAVVLTGTLLVAALNR